MFTSDNSPFRVIFENFSETHYIKSFQKKYKNNWLVTRRAIVAQLNNVDTIMGSGRLRGPISESEDKSCAIYKLYFAVAGRRESPKDSGNRVILFIDYNSRTVRVLLVYSKNEIGPPNETTKWQVIVNAHYREIMDLLK